MGSLQRALKTLIFFTVLLQTHGALAYCLAAVDATTGECAADGEAHLFWSRSCTSYAFHAKAFERLPLLDETSARTIAQQSFQTWEAVDCGQAPFSVQQLSGTTTADPIAFSYDEPNDFVLSALTRSEWSQLGESNRIFAITFLWHHPDTGEIYDVDLALNLGIGDFGICDRPCTDGTIDLQNTLTHEAGHVLGLGHTSTAFRDATMYPDATAGANFMRTLTPDDMSGLCALDLPPHECSTPASCVCPAPSALSSPHKSTSCAVVMGSPAGTAALFFVLAVPAALLVRRRKFK